MAVYDDLYYKPTKTEEEKAKFWFKRLFPRLDQEINFKLLCNNLRKQLLQYENEC